MVTDITAVVIPIVAWLHFDGGPNLTLKVGPILTAKIDPRDQLNGVTIFHYITMHACFPVK